MLIDAFADLPSADELARCEPHELESLMAGLEARRRAVEAEQVAVLEVVAARGLHRADGHRSVGAWHRATVNSSASAARRRVRTARLTSAVPVVARAVAEGRLGIEQAHEMARAHANPRCGHRISEVADVLVEAAATLSFEDFRALVRRWEMLADLDGAHASSEAARRNRRAGVSLSAFGFHLDATGPKLEGAAMVEIFNRFCDAEFRRDLDAARIDCGDDAGITIADLQRTAAQRSFDALFEIFRRAAATPPGSRVPEPLVNVVVDARTLAEFLDDGGTGHPGAHASPAAQVRFGARAGTGTRSPVGSRRAGLGGSGDLTSRRCETVDGVGLTPADVVTAALWGHIRRVLVESDGVVLDLGRRRRVFTGASRDAVMLGASHCVWPGCMVPLRNCQADHLTAWADRGTTSADNGAPLCGRHNRHKIGGYEVWRDEHGRWHTRRPDGTEMAWDPGGDPP
jgi:hypothetical protein